MSMQTALLGGGTPDSNTNQSFAQYSFIMNGRASWSAPVSIITKSNVIAVAGTISNLRVKSEGSPYRFTLYKNGVATSLKTQVADASSNKLGADTTNSVSVVPGDTLSLESIQDLTLGPLLGNGIVSFSMIIECADCTSVLMGGVGGTAGVLENSTTIYHPICGVSKGTTGTESIAAQIVPTKGTIKKMYLAMESAPGAGTSYAFTVFKNGVATGITATIADTATTATDLTNSISVSPGDTISLRVVPTGSAAEVSCSWSFEFDPAVNGQSMIMLATAGSGTNGRPKTGSNSFAFLLGGAGDGSTTAWLTNEASLVHLGVACTVKNLRVKVATAPGSGSSWQVALRQNLATSALSATISGTETSKENTADSISVAADDVLAYIAIPTSSPAVTDIQISMTVSISEELCTDCDTTDYRYRLDYALDAQRPAQDVLNDMLATFSGFLVYSGSKVKLRIEKVETITQYFGDGSTTKANATFDPGNIVKDSFSWNMPSIDERPNRIRVQWVDPDQNYVKVYTQVDDRIDQDDRNTIITRDVSLLGITRASQASRMAKFILASIKYAAVNVSFSARLDSIHCEVGDVIAVTQQSAQFVRKLLRITDMQEAENELIRLTCKEYNPSLYDDHLGAGAIQMVLPVFTNPYAPLSDPTNIALTESGFLIAGGTWVTNIDVTWTALNPDEKLRLSHYVIQISDNGGSSYTDVGTAGNTATSFRITLGNARTGTSLMVRVRSVSLKGVFSTGANTATITLVGKTTPPSNVSNFVGAFSSDHVALIWSPVSDSDLFGYEIRIGDSNSSWETASIVVTEYLGSNYNAFNVAPGVRKFLIKAIDNSGNYSASAASTTVTVPGSPGTTVVFEFDILSRITVLPHPLQGTLSSELDRTPTPDHNPTFNRLALHPKTVRTFVDAQAEFATWAALQSSGLVFGINSFVTSQESYETEAIDLGGTRTGTFILDLQTYSLNNQGVLIAQISLSTDGITFGAYQGFISGQYTASHVKLKFLLQATTAPDIIRLAGAKLIITSP